MVVADVSVVAIEDFSNLIYCCVAGIFGPEWLLDMRNSVDSYAVESVGLDLISNPVFQILSDPWLLLVKIRQVSKSAVFYLPLVVPIVDRTVGMVMVSLVQRVDLREIFADRSDMVSYNICHYPHSHGVGSVNQVLKAGSISEVAVDLFPVHEGIAVVGVGEVIYMRGDPYSIKA